MTKVYFVRHAQPEYEWLDDRTRPLTAEGKDDAKVVQEFFENKQIHLFYCSPYTRSIDTIAATAKFFNQPIFTDERFREREKGRDGNNYGMFQKRWSDMDFHEAGGESIHMVQDRNIEALEDLLKIHAEKVIIIGTHGTALSSIINYYNSDFGCNDFLRMIDWMPYIVEMQFDGLKLLKLNEHIHIQKEFKGNKTVHK